MIVVAIIGILAVVALLAYQDYTAKSHVIGAKGEISGAKTNLQGAIRPGISQDEAIDLSANDAAGLKRSGF